MKQIREPWFQMYSQKRAWEKIKPLRQLCVHIVVFAKEKSRLLI